MLSAHLSALQWVILLVVGDTVGDGVEAALGDNVRRAVGATVPSATLLMMQWVMLLD